MNSRKESQREAHYVAHLRAAVHNLEAQSALSKLLAQGQSCLSAADHEDIEGGAEGLIGTPPVAGPQ